MWMPELQALVMHTPDPSEPKLEKALRNWRRLGGMTLVKAYHTESPRKGGGAEAGRSSRRYREWFACVDCDRRILHPEVAECVGLHCRNCGSAMAEMGPVTDAEWRKLRPRKFTVGNRIVSLESAVRQCSDHAFVGHCSIAILESWQTNRRSHRH